MPFEVYLNGGDRYVGSIDDSHADTDELNDFGLAANQKWMYLAHGAGLSYEKVIIFSRTRMSDKDIVGLAQLQIRSWKEYRLTRTRGLIDFSRKHYVESNRIEWPHL